MKDLNKNNIENAAFPKIEIFCGDLQSEAIARSVGYGIEEEGLPYYISIGEYVWTDVYENSQSSVLGVAILVQEGRICVYARQLKEKRPLFNSYARGSEQAKIIGKNAARIIKNKPFIEGIPK